MIVGLDISTSIIGVCILNNDGTPESFSYVDLRKVDDFIDKVEALAYSISTRWDPNSDEHKFGFRCDHLFIEDKLSGFSSGKSTQQTMMKLASFNGASSYAAFENYYCRPVHLHPSTIKALMKRDGLIIPKGGDKKKLSLDFVKAKFPIKFPYIETRNGNPQAYCYDMTDAYLTARAGYLKFLCNKTKS